MKIIIIIFMSVMISVSSAEDIKISNTDLMGLVKCQNIIFNIVELTVNKGKIVDYFNNPEITHWIFRETYSNDNYFNLIKTINSRFLNNQLIYDKIEFYYSVSTKMDGTKIKNKQIKIQIRSVTTNKILICFFRIDKDDMWKLSGYAECINYHEMVPHMEDPGPPCIDE